MELGYRTSHHHWCPVTSIWTTSLPLAKTDRALPVDRLAMRNTNKITVVTTVAPVTTDVIWRSELVRSARCERTTAASMIATTMMKTTVLTPNSSHQSCAILPA